MIKIALKTITSKKDGKDYEFLSVMSDDTEIVRSFIKPTEKQFFLSVCGDYEKKLVNQKA